jgi:hypothetical protein
MATVRHLGLFPWCPFQSRQEVIDTVWLGESSPVTSTINSYEGLETSMADALALYWRVKSWRVEGSLTAGSGAGVVTIDYSDVVTRPLWTNEKDLVCRRIEGEGESAYWNVPDFNGFSWAGNVPGLADPVIWDFEFKLHWMQTAGFPLNFRKGPHHLSQEGFSENGGIYTWLSFSYATNDPGDFSFGSIVCGYFSEETENITVPILFLDKTYSIKAQRVGGEGSASMSIAAEEYWPYDPGDGGGPIYDSTTGAQLRPFPN